MALTSNEKNLGSAHYITDTEGRLVVVGPDGVAISGAGSDPAEGTPASAVPSKAMFSGGTDGTNLRGFATDASGIQKVDIAGADVTHPASAETGTVYNGTTALTPKYAFANVAASQTDSSIVAAVTSKKIRVLAAFAIAGATATDLTFNTKPAGAGSAKSAKLANGANGGAVLPFNQTGWFETASGEGLTVTTGAGSTTGIQVVYVEV